MREVRSKPNVIQLQHWDQRVREGRAVGAGFGVAQRDMADEAGARRALVSYAAGISACEKGDQWQRAGALLSEMREAQLEPDVIRAGRQGGLGKGGARNLLHAAGFGPAAGPVPRYMGASRRREALGESAT
ncbi:unnamed protein product [Prorocentrum cordatum]|uniref:Uncharacterized protein n=1 Tax=Prorocentrum cordatum TaxID=2364126 RepID=A0ABN9TCP8_9DINO|nr:unnamed protein product [Polarella glacialis]